MKRVFLYVILLLLVAVNACRDDESYKQNEPVPGEPKQIQLTLTSRVGTVVGDHLTQYVKAMNLFLFRENENGNYVLFRTKVLNKEELESLAEQPESSAPGFTLPRVVTFDTVPLANYKIVGVGNVLDSVGNAQTNVSLEGVTIGNDMSQVLAVVNDGVQASRLFWGVTDVIQLGAIGNTLAELSLYRKVSMFALTLEKIPDVVDKIDTEIENTYGKFDMGGNFVSGSAIWVFATNEYQQQVQDSITLTYVTFPTVAGDSSTFLTTFYLINGPKQPVTLPKYVLKPNTITKVTATIDTDQPGSAWKVDISSLISVDVEWNVDQEPPITI